MKKIKRIVFTGGPCAGKTSIIELICRKYPQIFVPVPEAASILYGGGVPRLKQKDAIIHTQRAIYFLIKELEDMYEKLYPNKIQLCDRGTLDGIAYWPEDEKIDFLKSLNTDLEKEFLRYDVLIHLRSPRNPEIYKLSTTRNEDHKLAIEIDIKIEKAWEKHPKRYLLNDEEDFLDKVEKTIKIIENIIQYGG